LIESPSGSAGLVVQDVTGSPLVLKTEGCALKGREICPAPEMPLKLIRGGAATLKEKVLSDEPIALDTVTV
jgi:hypothetical protein